MTAEEYGCITVKHLELANKRGPNKTYCPSKVARSLFPQNWQEKMDDVRKVADDLWSDNILIVSQFGKDLSIPPSSVKGHIRLRILNKKTK